jgi:hypothetical protein
MSKKGKEKFPIYLRAQCQSTSGGLASFSELNIIAREGNDDQWRKQYSNMAGETAPHSLRL